MVNMINSTIKNETCFELVNNIRVLQPAYMKAKERTMFESKVRKLTKTSKLLRRLNETFIYQRMLKIAELRQVEREQ